MGVVVTQPLAVSGILEAHERFRQGDYRIPVTDDTMLAEIFLRKKAKLVRGSYTLSSDVDET